MLLPNVDDRVASYLLAPVTTAVGMFNSVAIVSDSMEFNNFSDSL